MTVGDHVGLDEHLKLVPSEAPIRQGVSDKAATSSWVPDAGVLRMTYDATIASLLRYALVLTVSRFWPDLPHKFNTQRINIASWRIVGLIRTPRLEGLHFRVPPSSNYYLYFLHCAEC